MTPLLDVDLVSRYRLATSPEERAALDHRIDLVQMDPYAFEGLIAALFRAKGYEAWRTQSSRDDGIDAIATRADAHVPVECRIQVKRTRNVVALVQRPLPQAGQDRRIGTMEGGGLREQIKAHLGRDVVISAEPLPRRR